MMTTEDWSATLRYCGCAQIDADKWAPVFEQHCQARDFSLGLEEMDDFVGQILTESYWLRRLEENLNYSPGRLMQVWPDRFPSIEATMTFAWHPEALANKVYGGRLGNVNSGDGWRYRGRGLIMATGASNYLLIDQACGTDFVTNPDKLALPEQALQVAISWWERRVPDAAMGDIIRVTKAVQGGSEGIVTRKSITTRAKERLHD